MTTRTMGEVDRVLSDAWATIQNLEDTITEGNPARMFTHQRLNANLMAMMPADGMPGVLAKLRAAALFIERGDDKGRDLLLSATEDAARLIDEPDSGEGDEPTPLAFAVLWEQRRLAAQHHRRSLEWIALDSPDDPDEPATTSTEPDNSSVAHALLDGIEDAVGALVPQTVEQAGMQAAMALLWLVEGFHNQRKGIDRIIGRVMQCFDPEGLWRAMELGEVKLDPARDFDLPEHLRGVRP